MSPALWQKNRSRRSAQIRGSSWRMLPAVDVAGVGERRLALASAASSFKQHQVGVGHVDFAADFQERRDAAGPTAAAECP